MATGPVLLRQWDMARSLLDHHLDGLTTDACLWRPAARGLHLVRDGQGVWRAEWPEHERYDLGPPSIGWTTWHLGFWLTTLLDHASGPGTLERARIVWPGGADAACDWIRDLADRWRVFVAGRDENELEGPASFTWPLGDRPLADVVAWSTVEMTKNAAEIGMGRFLFAVRAGGSQEG